MDLIDFPILSFQTEEHAKEFANIFQVPYDNPSADKEEKRESGNQMRDEEEKSDLDDFHVRSHQFIQTEVHADLVADAIQGEQSPGPSTVNEVAQTATLTEVFHNTQREGAIASGGEEPVEMAIKSADSVKEMAKEFDKTVAKEETKDELEGKSRMLDTFKIPRESHNGNGKH